GHGHDHTAVFERPCRIQPFKLHVYVDVTQHLGKTRNRNERGSPLEQTDPRGLVGQRQILCMLGYHASPSHKAGSPSMRMMLSTPATTSLKRPNSSAAERKRPSLTG